MTIASFTRQALGFAALVMAGASGAQVRSDVTPYIEVQQVLTADLNGGPGDDVLTYTAVAAGIDAAADTPRLQAQASYRYERRISWNDDLVDDDVHSGIAQARFHAVPGALVIEGGALAARARADGDAPVFGTTAIDDPRVAEVYGVYAGPSLSTHVGPVDVAASYRLSYVKVDDHSLAGVPLAPGATVRDHYDSSVGHNVSLSVGMDPGELPFGWTVGAGYGREDVDRLDQEYEGKYIRADVVLPVSPTLALTAGVGYEDIDISQQDILRDSNGIPVVTPGGRLIEDPSRPRLAVSDLDGLIWDAGVIWRPSRHTEVQARVGERYGGTSFTGSLEHRFNSAWGLSIVVYDNVDSFGRLLITDLRGVPTQFDIRRNPLFDNIGGIGGCVFGGEAGSGVCFDDALQTISTSNFRNRGANVLLSGGRGLWSYHLGAGYANRKYLTPVGFDFDRTTDESYTVQAGAGRELSPTSSINFDAYAAWFDSDLAISDGVFGAGATASYSKRFLIDRLEGQAAIGIFHSDSGLSDSTAASALIGLRYSF